MANALTGDFDVVVEVGVRAVNRFLAVQHQDGAYLHSISVRVDDFGPQACWTESRPRHARATGVRGLADVQIAAPRLTLPVEAGESRVTVNLELRTRFRADAASPALPEFAHGNVAATVDVSQVASQNGNVLEVDLAADSLEVAFSAIWTSTPLSPAQNTLIADLLRNQLLTRFQPLSAALPPGLGTLRFKTLPDPSAPAIALLLALRGQPSPDPAGVTRALVGADDDFAVAVGADFLVDTVRSAAGGNGGFHREFDVSFDINFLLFSVTVTYHITLDSLDLELVPGAMNLRIGGRARTSTFLAPDFDFVVTQRLLLVVQNGEAALVADGGPDIDIHDGIGGLIVSLFKGTIASGLTGQRDALLQQIQPTVRAGLSPQRGLGVVLAALRIPATLAYTSAETTRDGVILRGTAAVAPWKRPEALRNATTFHNPDGSTEIELDALKSWIPGGRIQRFVWTNAGLTRPVTIVEEHRFVTRAPVDANTAAAPWCLRIEGSQPGLVGSAPDTLVNRTRCPVPPNIAWKPPIIDPRLIPRLPVAVLRPSPEGLRAPPELVGHVDLLGGDEVTATTAASFVIQFAGTDSAASLNTLEEALRLRGRRDALVAVMVLPAGDLVRSGLPAAGPNEAVFFTADEEGSWRRLFASGGAPETVIAGPDGVAIWRHTGALDARALADALDAQMPPGGRLPAEAAPLGVIAGRVAPDFLFPYAPGHCIPLRRFRGQEVVLGFWTSWSAPSLIALRRLQEAQRAAGRGLVLAINDGEDPRLAARVLCEQGITLPLVPDPERSIARQYAIRGWPSTIAIDPAGLIADAQIGLSPMESCA